MTVRVRGYTMTELVVAASITLVACLGGATAARVAMDMSVRARVEKAFGVAVARADAAAPRGLCAALAALGPGAACVPAVVPPRPQDAPAAAPDERAPPVPAPVPPSVPVSLDVLDGRTPLLVSARAPAPGEALWQVVLSARVTPTEELTHVVLVAR